MTARTDSVAFHQLTAIDLHPSVMTSRRASNAPYFVNYPNLSLQQRLVSVVAAVIASTVLLGGMLLLFDLASKNAGGQMVNAPAVSVSKTAERTESPVTDPIREPGATQ